jgi:flagellar biosynthesis/type III secretory pathway protein FliH
MPVLKQIDVAPLLNDPTIVLDLGDLKRQATRMIAAAEQEAERILATAREAATDEANRIRVEAEAIGRTEGEQAGRAEGERSGHAEAMVAASTSLGELQEAWTSSLITWSQHQAADLAAAREDVVALALAIAERVVHRTIACDPDVAVRQTAAALDLLAEARAVRVSVNAEDRARIDEALPELVRALSGDARVQLVDDERVTPGGVIVHSGDGVIDARIAVQIERIAEALVPGRTSGERLMIDREDADDAARAVAAADAETHAQTETDTETVAETHAESEAETDAEVDEPEHDAMSGPPARRATGIEGEDVGEGEGEDEDQDEDRLGAAA